MVTVPAESSLETISRSWLNATINLALARPGFFFASSESKPASFILWATKNPAPTTARTIKSRRPPKIPSIQKRAFDFFGGGAAGGTGESCGLGDGVLDMEYLLR